METAEFIFGVLIMMKPLFFAVLPPLALALCLRAPAAPADALPVPTVDRSPTDLALSASGDFAVTANYTANTASLVNLTTGKVTGEVAVGQKPFAVALLPGGNAPWSPIPGATAFRYWIFRLRD